MDITPLTAGEKPLVVHRIGDDSPVPATGRVVGHGPVFDGERQLAVVWGDQAWTWREGKPVPDEVTLIPFDELTPAGAPDLGPEAGE
jgi:hypothetical protein